MGTELNTSALLDLGQALEAGDVGQTGGVGFNMWSFNPTNDLEDTTQHGCATACCIAGWSHLLAGGDPRKDVSPSSERVRLGLSEEQAEQLFAPDGYMSYRPLTPAHAAAVIRHLVASGEVDWHRFDELSPEAELYPEALAEEYQP